MVGGKGGIRAGRKKGSIRISIYTVWGGGSMGRAVKHREEK